jgi:hypothetical protein
MEVFPPGFRRTTRFLRDLQKEYSRYFEDKFREDR